MQFTYVAYERIKQWRPANYANYDKCEEEAIKTSVRSRTRVINDDDVGDVLLQDISLSFFLSHVLVRIHYFSYLCKAVGLNAAGLSTNRPTYIRAALLFNDFASCTVVLAVEK